MKLFNILTIKKLFTKRLTTYEITPHNVVREIFPPKTKACAKRMKCTLIYVFAAFILCWLQIKQTEHIAMKENAGNEKNEYLFILECGMKCKSINNISQLFWGAKAESNFNPIEHEMLSSEGLRKMFQTRF